MGYTLNTHSFVHHNGKFKRYYNRKNARVFREGNRLVVNQPFLNRDGTLLTTEKVYVVDTLHNCSVELREEKSSEECLIEVNEFDYHRFRLQSTTQRSYLPDYTPGTKIKYWQNGKW